MSGDGTNGDDRPHVDLRAAGAEELRRVMDLGVRRALAEHRRAGRSIAVWDYRAVAVRMIPPEEIPQADDPEAGPPPATGDAAPTTPRSEG